MSSNRLDFELDHEIGIGPVTAHGGVPVLVAARLPRVLERAGILKADAPEKP